MRDRSSSEQLPASQPITPSGALQTATVAEVEDDDAAKPGSTTDDLSDEDDADGYYVIPEEALQYLPEEWQAEIRARAEDGRNVLQTADKELKQLSRLSLSMYHVTVLKHIRDRLAAYRFRADMVAILELDMLTTAFLATYVRLFTGGAGSGFTRDALPASLRDAHDEIVELRNKRYAHVEDHHSVGDEMEIQEADGRFIVKLGTRLGVYIGGSGEWTKLVDALDELFADRADKIIRRLEACTGRGWEIARGPAPQGEASGG